MLLRALRPFSSHPDTAEVVVVLPPPIAAAPPDWLAGLAGERLRLVGGGETRTDSVEAGLRALSPATAIVLIHDAARPFPDPGVIGAVIGEARKGNAAIAAIPLHDTVKAAHHDPATARRTVAHTVPREGLWRAQTPQGFPRRLLEEAFRAARAAGIGGTDESALVERLGAEVVLVPDVSTNLKVTTADDLRLAEALAGP